MDTLEQAIEEAYACDVCSTKLYGESPNLELRKVTWFNKRIFVDAKDDGFLFCDKHFHGAKRKWARLMKKHG
jgi:hypothetical protein